MKEVKDIYNKIYKSLNKEIKEDIRRRKDIPCSLIDRIKYCENIYTIKSILYVQYIPLQNSNEILHRDRKVNTKIHMKAQNTSKSQSNLIKKSNTGGITIPNFKLY
jgi:hypothetical protein